MLEYLAESWCRAGENLLMGEIRDEALQLVRLTVVCMCRTEKQDSEDSRSPFGSQGNNLMFVCVELGVAIFIRVLSPKPWNSNCWEASDTCRGVGNDWHNWWKAKSWLRGEL